MKNTQQIESNNPTLAATIPHSDIFEVLLSPFALLRKDEKIKAGVSRKDKFTFSPSFHLNKSRMANCKADFVAFFNNTLIPIYQEYFQKHLKDEKYKIDSLLEMTKYNVEGGKLTRGLTVVQVASIHGLTGIDGDNKKQSDKYMALGWCIELLQASFLVADDIMDNSLVRRGQPCWWRKVGMTAINDVFIIQSLLYYTLAYFWGKECAETHAALTSLFNETKLQTELGQSLDLSQNAANYYTRDNYERIIRLKTSYYSFYLPVACVLLTLKNVPAAEMQALLATSQEILIKLGMFFQIQDDYLDCFGDSSVIGKVGTDIEEKKCCWPYIKAHELLSGSKEAFLEDGCTSINSAKLSTLYDGQHVSEIKSIYKALNLPQHFTELQENTRVEIEEMISRIKGSDKLSQSLVYLAAKIFYRSK